MKGEKPGRVLMVVGTCSNAGKSITVAALCRIFARRGLKVAPFKAQNMSLNSGVTAEGHEIARSVCVQAAAAGVAPHVDMNPVLLKPEGEKRSQVILAGRPRGHLDAKDWMARKKIFWQEITAALDRLRARFDLVIIEGAGSPAEINLAAGDVANLRVAAHAGAPALLVGDIDRGGVFASLLGTMMCLPEDQRRCVKGFVINKLRGDARLLGDGPEELSRRAFGVPTVGVVPFLPDLGLPEEDSVALDGKMQQVRAHRSLNSGSEAFDIAVIRLPKISNFDDLDALEQEPGVALRWVREPAALAGPATPDVVVLPGSKTTLADLEWLRETGLADAVVAAAAAGSQIVGICGGYQMLGEHLVDTEGWEAPVGSAAPGLGLLPQRTEFRGAKRTRQAMAELCDAPGPWRDLAGLRVSGYEIHVGKTTMAEGARPLFRSVTEPMAESMNVLSEDVEPFDGAVSENGRIWGTYLHGLFNNDDFRHAWLRALGWQGEEHVVDHESAFERLADHFEAHLEMETIHGWLGEGYSSQPLPQSGEAELEIGSEPESDPEANRHGGDPERELRRYGLAVDMPVADYSANLSPFGPPQRIRDLWPKLWDEVESYPSLRGSGVNELYERRFGIDPARVLPGNGATELIYLIPRVLGWRRAIVPSPAYADYGRACELAGVMVTDLQLTPEQGFAFPDEETWHRLLAGEGVSGRAQPVDAVFLGHPNNPTGALFDPDQLRRLARAHPRVWWVVDESFMQLTDDPSRSLVLGEQVFGEQGQSGAPPKNVLVVHSLTKTYALAGLRLGALLGDPQVVARLRRAKEPWSVNGIADRVARELVHCQSYEAELRNLLRRERSAMVDGLGTLGFEVFPPAANFVLARSPHGSLDDLLRALLSRGFCVRDGRNFKGLEEGFFRVAVRGSAENQALLEALQGAVEEIRPEIRVEES